MVQISKFDIICPKWALPREDLPIHIKIAKEITPSLKKATIELPDCFELKDTINIDKFEARKDEIDVLLIGKTAKSQYDYFGIIIATKEPFNDLKKEIPIKIQFLFNDGHSEQEVIFARIFRPLLEIETMPENIILNDDSAEQTKIPIGLKFTGFGELSLRTECVIGGKIVSVGTSILDEILKRILDEGLISDEELKAEFGVNVDRKYIEGLLSDFRQKYLKDDEIKQMLEQGKISKEIADIMYNFSHENQEKFMNIFYKTIETYLIKIISDVLRRNVSNNLQLETEAKIQTSIKLPSTDVTIKFFYRDNLGNEYEPIIKTIQIIDKRENPAGFDVEIPVVITRVDESDAYKNVGRMRIGTIH